MALVGVATGVVSAGALPTSAQILPRILVISATIAILMWLSQNRVAIGRSPLATRPVWLVAGALAVLAAGLEVAGAGRTVWLGLPGTAAALVLLGGAALALRSATRIPGQPR